MLQKLTPRHGYSPRRPGRLRLRLHTAGGEARRFEALAHAVREPDAGGGSLIRGAVLVLRDVTGLRDSDGRVTHYVAMFRELGSQGADEGMLEYPAQSA